MLCIVAAIVQIVCCLIRFVSSDSLFQIRLCKFVGLFLQICLFIFFSSDSILQIRLLKRCQDSSQRLDAHTRTRGFIETVHHSLCSQIAAHLRRIFWSGSSAGAAVAMSSHGPHPPAQMLCVCLLPAPGLGSCYAFVCSEFLFIFVCSDLFANCCSSFKFVCAFSFAFVCSKLIFFRSLIVANRSLTRCLYSLSDLLVSFAETCSDSFAHIRLFSFILLRGFR